MTSRPFDAEQDLREAPRDPAGPRRPAPAATLILLRRDKDGASVLMGRRVSGHAFMASKWVFPGGRLDRGDWRAPAATEPDPGRMGALVATSGPTMARALAMAAVRETFEETGLLVARPGSGRSRAAGWSGFLDKGALPDLASLTFVARAITPPGRSRRFDARFFSAPASALLTLDPSPGCGELEEIAWFRLDEALALDLPAITRFVLGEIEQGVGPDEDRPPPFVRMVRGRHVIER